MKFARIIFAVCCHASLVTACVRTECTDAACELLDAAALYSELVNTTVFVTTGLAGALRTSFDGKTWQSQTVGASTLNAVGYDKNFFYAVGNADSAYISSDALTWTALTSLNTGVSDGYFSIAANNGVLVAGGSTGSGQVRQSANNGVSWTSLPTTNGASELSDIEIGAGVFRGVNGSGEFMRFSNDASSYTATTIPGAPALNALIYQDGLWLAVGDTGFITRSVDDGASWSSVTVNAAHTLFGVAYGNGRFVATGHDGTNATIWTSTDSGASWVLSSPPFGRTRGIAFGNDVFVIVGNGGLLAYSATPEVGSSWTDLTTGTSNLFDISARSLRIFGGPLAVLN